MRFGVDDRRICEMEKSSKPWGKQGQQKTRTPEKNIRKQRSITLERLVRCTDKTTSVVCSSNLKSTSDWRYRET